MANKYITDEIFKKGISDVMQTVADNTYEFEPYSTEEIASAFELSPEEQRSLSEVINDTVYAKNKVYSSEYTLELLEKAKAECNQYAVEQLANSGNLKRKIISSDSEVIDENILYLILTDSTNNIYTQYVLIDGIATPLGNTQIDLSGYLLIDDFNTTIADYAKKTEVVSQNDVVNDLTTVSSSTVLSSQGTSNELDKKIDKTSIVTTIDSTSTDTQVPSAKAVYDVIKPKVADVGKTLITFPDSTNHKVITSAETYYIVKNGICYIHLSFGCVLENATTTITGLPLPLANTIVYAPQAVPYDYGDLTSIRVRVLVNPYGILELIGGSAGIPYVCSFSYPVAES